MVVDVRWSDYNPGKEVFYHGDEGAIYKVKVLQNNSDPNKERYFLRVLRVIQDSANDSRTLEIGDEFERKKQRHILKDLPERFSWELLDEEENSFFT